MLRLSRFALVLAVLTTAGSLVACGTDEPRRPEPDLRVDPKVGLEIADGLHLMPAADGTLPVSVRWIVDAVAPDGLAVDGQAGFLFGGDSFDRFNIDNGETTWSAVDPKGEGFPSSGDVRIGSDSEGHVEVWAPYDLDLVVDRRSGRVLRQGIGYRPMASGKTASEPPSSFTMFEQQRYDPETDSVWIGSTEFLNLANQVVARGPDGKPLWSIKIDQPMFDNLGPVEVPGGMIIVLANEKMIRLDYGPSSK